MRASWPELTIDFYSATTSRGCFSRRRARHPDRTMEQMIGVLELLREGVRVSRLHPRQGNPGRGRAACAASGAAGGPSEHQHRAAPASAVCSCWPRTRRSRHSGSDGAGEPRGGREHGGTGRIPRRAALCAGRAEHADDRGEGATPETDYHILHLTESLYRKCSLKRVFFLGYIPVAARRPAAVVRYKTAASTRAPALSGRLAAAVLSVFGGGAARRAEPELQPLSRPEMQLGREPSGAVPCGCEPLQL